MSRKKLVDAARFVWKTRSNLSDEIGRIKREIGLIEDLADVVWSNNNADFRLYDPGLQGKYEELADDLQELADSNVLAQELIWKINLLRMQRIDPIPAQLVAAKERCAERLIHLQDIDKMWSEEDGCK